jgi:hypothetical protein
MGCCVPEVWRSGLSMVYKYVWDFLFFLGGTRINRRSCLQVCLLQIPAMVAFTAFYSIGKESMVGHAFSYVLCCAVRNYFFFD